METSTKILIGLGVVALAGFCFAAAEQSTVKEKALNKNQHNCEQEALFLKGVAMTYRIKHIYAHGATAAIDYDLLNDVIDTELELINLLPDTCVLRPRVIAAPTEARLESTLNGATYITVHNA